MGGCSIRGVKRMGWYLCHGLRALDAVSVQLQVSGDVQLVFNDHSGGGATKVGRAGSTPGYASE